MRQLPIYVLLALLVGCSERSSDNSVPRSTTSPDQKTVAGKETSRTEAIPREAHSSGTGVKEKVLLGVMNANGALAPQFHHSFVEVSNRDAPVRSVTYRDQHSGLALNCTGPEDNLTTIMLGMPLDEFMGEKAGQEPGDGAAAFGRCVQRMTVAADPNWCADLYKWMNQEMAKALITPEGVSTTRKDLKAAFTLLDSSERKLVLMVIMRRPPSP